MNGPNGQTTKLQPQGTEHGGEKISGGKLRQLVEAQEFRCALSGVELTPEVAEADHIDPLCNGGTNTMENMQIVHATINTMKGTLTQEEFIGWCKRVAGWTG